MRKTTTAPRTEYRNPFMEVRHTRADFGAFQKDYFVIELGPRAGVVALRGRRVLLTRQYRFLIDGPSWEIPGGRVEAGEDPQAAAVRECLEETGVECRGLKRLLEYFPGLDNFNNRTTLFVSRDARTLRAFTAQAAEVTEVRWIGLDKALRMVGAGEILDALTVTGLLACKALAA